MHFLQIASIIGHLLISQSSAKPIDANKLRAELQLAARMMSDADADALEAKLVAAPDDTASRAKLLAFYSPGRNYEKSKEHYLWFLEHQPESDVLQYPVSWHLMDPDAFNPARDLWLRHIDADPTNISLLANAAAFMTILDASKSIELMERAEKVDPSNPDWPLELGQLYSRQDKFRFPPDKERDEEVCNKSLAAFERGLSLLPKADRYLVLDDVGKAAVDAGDLGKARQYATELLEAAVDAPADWNYGNAVHQANLILGRVALLDGRVEEAEAFLLQAGRTPGSPSLNSFGPNMALADALLEKGRRDSVLEYFKLCGKFWNRPKLQDWIKSVERGGRPDFGANLVY